VVSEAHEDFTRARGLYNGSQGRNLRKIELFGPFLLITCELRIRNLAKNKIEQFENLQIMGDEMKSRQSEMYLGHKI